MRIFLITSKLNFEQNGSAERIPRRIRAAEPVGGSVVDLHLKAKGLTELGHEVTVVTAFSESNKLFAPLPYTVIERRIAGRGLAGLQLGVYMLLKEFEAEADVFYIDGHIFLYGAGAYRMLGGKVPVAGFFNIRLNSWADTSGNALRPPLYRRVKKSTRFFLEKTFGAPVANHLDAFIFNTPHVQKLYHDFGIGTTKRNALVQDCIATAELGNRFGISQVGVREHQERTPPVVLLATGRMIPEKGFELLLRAFAGVRDRQKYTLILSGGGPDKERLETLSDELGIKASVEFPGWVPREELYGFFAKAHVFIFPRWWLEYGSAVLTEAMAFGLPSIIPGGGALEWLTAGSALTFKNENALELRACIEAFGNTGLRQTHALRSLSQGKTLDSKTLAVRLEKALTDTTR